MSGAIVLDFFWSSELMAKYSNTPKTAMPPIRRSKRRIIRTTKMVVRIPCVTIMTTRVATSANASILLVATEVM